MNRFDLQYAANYYLSPSIPLGEAVDAVKRVAAKVLPPGYAVRFTGQAEGVDLTNQRRNQGMQVDQALRDACPIRLRPVLMTSSTLLTLVVVPSLYSLVESRRGAAAAPS